MTKYILNTANLFAVKDKNRTSGLRWMECLEEATIFSKVTAILICDEKNKTFKNRFRILSKDLVLPRLRSQKEELQEQLESIKRRIKATDLIIKKFEE